MGEREARAQQGKRGVRRQRLRCGTGKLHAWGKDWRGPKTSGIGKSEATIQISLKSWTQVLASAHIKMGQHSWDLCSHLGAVHIWESVKHLGKCMPLPAPCPATGSWGN